VRRGTGRGAFSKAADPAAAEVAAPAAALRLAIHAACRHTPANSTSIRISASVRASRAAAIASSAYLRNEFCSVMLLLCAGIPPAVRPKLTMPNTISLYQVGVWFAVGFFTGCGWAIALWLIGRLFSRL
jgi:hypothetical protein